MVRKEKESNRLRNFIWIISGILLLGIFSFIGVYAGNTISNSASSYYVADNITLNNTGVYYKTTSDIQKLTKTADVVVCRGTSAIDDLIKKFTCDITCASSDTDCYDEFKTATLNSNKHIYVTSGHYPINVANWNCSMFQNRTALIIMRDGMKFEGSSMDSTFIDLYGSVSKCGLAVFSNNQMESSTFQIKDLTIDMNLSNLNISDLGTSVGVYFNAIGIVSRNNSYEDIFENIKIKNCNLFEYFNTTKGTTNGILGGLGIDNFNMPRANFNNIHIENCDYGLWVTREFDDTESNNHFSNIYISNARRVGIEMEMGDGFQFNNVQIKDSNSPIRFAIGSTSNANFNNLYIRNSTGNVISFQPDSIVSNVNINNFLIDTTIDDSSANNKGINIANNVTNVKFSNGIITKTNGSAIYSLGKDINFDNIDVSNSSSTGIVIATTSISNLLNKVHVQFSKSIGIQLAGRCIDCTANDNDINSSDNENFYLQTSTATRNLTELVNPYCYSILGSNIRCIGMTAVTNPNNTAILNPRMYTSTGYFTFDGSNNHFGYMEGYVYPVPINQSNTPCATNNVFNERTIHNSSNSCTCTGGSWKCWAMT